MAHSLSAKKRVRQNAKRRVINRARKSVLKTQIKHLDTAIDAGDTDKVKDHFMNPRNILDDEEAFGADGSGVVGNIKCGDQMLIVINFTG